MTARTARIARRTAAGTVAFGIAPLTLGLMTANSASGHGSMTDPVSRVSACFAEGPENPQSAACKAAVEAGGTQALYDWNEVNIPDAAGKHKEIIPDGKLCSAGRDKYKGLDLPRADWPASEVSAGAHSFSYKATAPHKGTFQLYMTNDSYDPSKPLKWSDLEEKPFAEVKDPKLENGSYVFDGKIPERSGRQLIYSVWQRSDSPEAFYTCSDVDFGGGKAKDGGAAPSAPTDKQIAGGTEKSTVDHGGHGGDGHGDAPEQSGNEQSGSDHSEHSEHSDQSGTSGESDVRTNGEGKKPVGEPNLAETGGDDSTTPLAVGGAAALAVGTGVVFMTMRRRAALGRHRS